MDVDGLSWLRALPQLQVGACARSLVNATG